MCMQYSIEKAIRKFTDITHFSCILEPCANFAMHNGKPFKADQALRPILIVFSHFYSETDKIFRKKIHKIGIHTVFLSLMNEFETT